QEFYLANHFKSTGNGITRPTFEQAASPISERSSFSTAEPAASAKPSSDVKIQAPRRRNELRLHPLLLLVLVAKRAWAPAGRSALRSALPSPHKVGQTPRDNPPDAPKGSGSHVWLQPSSQPRPCELSTAASRTA